MFFKYHRTKKSQIVLMNAIFLARSGNLFHPKQQGTHSQLSRVVFSSSQFTRDKEPAEHLNRVSQHTDIQLPYCVDQGFKATQLIMGGNDCLGMHTQWKSGWDKNQKLRAKLQIRKNSTSSFLGWESLHCSITLFSD